MPEPYQLPELKAQAGFRLNEESRKDLRILLADRQETNVSKLLKELVAEAAAPVRARWEERFAAPGDES